MIKNRIVVQFIFKSGKVTKFTYGDVENLNDDISIKSVYKDIKQKILDARQRGNIIEVNNQHNTDYLFLCDVNSIDQVNVFIDKSYSDRN